MMKVILICLQLTTFGMKEITFNPFVLPNISFEEKREEIIFNPFTVGNVSADTVHFGFIGLFKSYK